jgi:HTH-type transcriptional regulator/antitoxin HigA
MRIRPIKTKDDFEMALSLIDQLWNAEYGTSEYDDFETLAICIESYEREKCAAEFSDPVEAIRYYMQQKEKSFDDLSALLGSSDIAFQVLYKEIPLTTDMIWKLCQNWSIPAECLIKPYQVGISRRTLRQNLNKKTLSCRLNFTKLVGHS